MQLDKIYHGDSLSVLKSFDSESVDLVITSPPYYGLRDYGVANQIGQEKTPQEYIQNLMRIMDECKRVLKKTGSIWVNIGDSYGGTGSKGDCKDPKYKEGRNGDSLTISSKQSPKSLLAIPERFVIAMTDSNWIRRNSVIWYKPNCMPSSTKDRFTVDFEYFYFFTKSQKYYFKTQYELAKEESMERYKYQFKDSKRRELYKTGSFSKDSYIDFTGLRLKRCVWKIPTKPFNGSKFLADYVGQDGKPYKASPSCPFHGHLVVQPIQQKVQYDAQSKASLNHNPDIYNYHVPKPDVESLSNSWNSNYMNNVSNEQQQNQPNNYGNKNNHEHEVQNVHTLNDNEQIPSHTKYSHTPYEQKPYNTDSSHHIDSPTAILHNKENHKNISRIIQYDNVSVKTPYDKPDISQTDVNDVYHLDISLNKRLEDYVSDEKVLNPLVQTPDYIVDTSTLIKNIGKTDKCVCTEIKTDHFAVFPEYLVETPIEACCPSEICNKCGKPKVKKFKSVLGYGIKESKTRATKSTADNTFRLRGRQQYYRSLGYESTPYVEDGFTDCGCNAGFHSGVVLDPFMGAGTVGVVAKKLGRRFVGVELNPEYIKISERRIGSIL